MNETRNKTYELIAFLIAIIIIALIAVTHISFKIQSRAYVIICAGNLRALYSALQKYAEDNNGFYPTPSKWCDLLVEKTGISKNKFYCRSAGQIITDNPIEETNSPVRVSFVCDYNDEQGKKKYVYNVEGSNYGLNPNVEPNSAPDVVLLFEIVRCWNQFGGPELVSVKNHTEIYPKEGCNVLFNDGSGRFVKSKDISELNWGKAHLRK